MSGVLDHIIWACDDLERGVRRFAALTGIRPAYGGAHAGGSTHNALVGLGPRCYLEILAPTGPPAAHDDAWCRLARMAHEPRVLTYCVRSERPLAEMTAAAEELGASPAPVLGNGRTTPAGVRLDWQWTAPQFERFALAFPFFIDWLDSPHPGESPAALEQRSQGRLHAFAVGHPEGCALGDALARLGVSIDTYAARQPEFRVHLETPRGLVSL